MVTLTEQAINAVRRFADASEQEVAGLRIFITPACGNTLKCGVRLERCAGPGDAVVDFGAVKVYLDPQSASLVDGATIDFVDDRDVSGFRFSNLRGRDN